MRHIRAIRLYSLRAEGDFRGAEAQEVPHRGLRFTLTPVGPAEEGLVLPRIPTPPRGEAAKRETKAERVKEEEESEYSYETGEEEPPAESERYSDLSFPPKGHTQEVVKGTAAKSAASKPEDVRSPREKVAHSGKGRSDDLAQAEDRGRVRKRAEASEDEEDDRVGPSERHRRRNRSLEKDRRRRSRSQEVPLAGRQATKREVLIPDSLLRIDKDEESKQKSSKDKRRCARETGRRRQRR